MRYSPRNITVACNHSGLTHFGGIYFFHEFLRVLQLRNFLARNLRYSRPNHRYSVSQMILALVYPLVLGLDRLETASFLRSQRNVSVSHWLAELSRSADIEAFSTSGARGVVGSSCIW
jgi:hypothetical protein